MITQDNITSHELIGLRARVASSASAQLVGMAGTVVYETKNMLLLETEGKTRYVAKKACTWEFDSDGAKITVSGADIAKRPADRIGARA